MKATQALIGSTWLADDELFACHDSVTAIDWRAVYAKLYAGEYDEEQMVLISVLSIIDQVDSMDTVSLEEILELGEHERLAVLDALRIHCDGIKLEENLV
jgi:DNA polymerase III alpha subunit (gram-positive type)